MPKVFAYILAALLAALGFIFIAGAQGQVVRVVVGVVLLLAAGGLIYLARLRPAETVIRQQIDLSGDVNVQEMTCRQCGGNLSRNSLEVRGGAIFVHCEYCGATYQLEEEPKW